MISVWFIARHIRWADVGAADGLVWARLMGWKYWWKTHNCMGSSHGTLHFHRLNYFWLEKKASNSMAPFLRSKVTARAGLHVTGKISSARSGNVTRAAFWGGDLSDALEPRIKWAFAVCSEQKRERLLGGRVPWGCGFQTVRSLPTWKIFRIRLFTKLTNKRDFTLSADFEASLPLQ